MQARAKKVMRWLGILFGIFMIFIFALSTFAWVYRDEIIAKTLEVLKQELTVPVSYKSVDVSIWTSFPLLAINFEDLHIADALNEKKDFVAVESFSLAFNWIDAWKGNYHVHQLKLKNGEINMSKNKLGKGNWEIFKKRASASSNAEMRLEQVIFKGVIWRFKDVVNQYSQIVFWDNMRLKGDFSAVESKLSISASGVFENLQSDGREIIEHLAFESSGMVSYQREKQLLALDQIEFEALDAPIQGSGWIDFKQEEMDVFFKAENIEVLQWVSNMRGWISDALHSYEPKGNFQLQGGLQGRWNNPKVEASLLWKEGSVKEPISGAVLENVDFQMTYQLKGGRDIWKVNHLNARLANGLWKINGEIKNTLKPELDLNIEMHSDIQEMTNFFKWDSLVAANGLLDIKANVQGTWNPNDSIWRWDGWKAEGNLSIKAESFQWHGMSYPIRELQALLQLHEENAILHQCVAKYEHSDIDITGQWHQAVSWLLNPNRGLDASVVLKSNFIQGEDFLQAEGSGFGLPAFSNVLLRCEVEKFAFKQFEAKNFATNISVQEGLIKAKDFQWELAEGKLMGDVELFANENSKQWEVDLNATIDKVNLSRLMVLFNEFGQSAIKSNQLKGSIDANVSLGFNLSKAFELDLPSINGVVVMNVVDGEIIHWSVLEDVAGYLKKNKWIAPLVDEDLLAKKLSWVKFDELRNTISISNQTIEIPWMEIKSSALNMVFKANHTFANELDYLMGFHVRDLLLRDPNQPPTEDGKKFFVSMKGPVSSLQFDVESDKEWKALFDESLPHRDRSVKKWLETKRNVLSDRREQRKESRDEQQNERRQDRLDNRLNRDNLFTRKKRLSKNNVNEN